MNSIKKMITSALVVAGATALSAGHAQATEDQQAVNPEQDLDLLELEVLEKALRYYTNPVQHVYDIMQEPSEDFITYAVQEGDTLSEIGMHFDIPVREIIQENQIPNQHRISIGQELKIRIKEKKYVIQYGETLEDVSKKTGVEVEKIVASNEVLKEMQYQTLPGQHLAIPTAPPEPVHQSFSTPRSKARVTIASRTEAAGEIGSIQWPVLGRLTSTYGMRWGRMHNGIDIAPAEQRDTEIRVVKDGIVEAAYYNRGGYGNLVIVDHGNGWRTYYAHLSKINVVEGQQVQQGHVVGYMGATGNVTGKHLHFEVRKGNRPLNPLMYLP